LPKYWEIVNKGGIFMAGSINTPSVIWVAGETQGRNQSGAVVTISGFLPESNSGIEVDVESYADSVVKVLHDRLVASGILES
jgi:hypothetical protein